MRLFFEAFVLGFSVAAPVGPIGLLCVRRTLANGRGAGLATGLGAASADAVYAVIAALGLHALATKVTWLQPLAAVYLVVLGVQLMRAPVAKQAAKTQLASAWGSTFALTILSPSTILSFVALFAAIVTPGESKPLALVSGVFLGSMTWWLALSTAVDKLRTRVTPERLRYVSVGAGAVIVLMAIAALLK